MIETILFWIIGCALRRGLVSVANKTKKLFANPRTGAGCVSWFIGCSNFGQPKAECDPTSRLWLVRVFRELNFRTAT